MTQNINPLGAQMSFLGRYAAWLLLLMWGQRLLFLAVNFPLSAKLDFWDLFGSFWYGLGLDLSACAYLLLLPCVGLLGNGIWYQRLLSWYSGLILSLLLLLALVDAGLYPHWGYRLDIGVWLYLKNPTAASASVKMADIIGLLLGFGLLFWGFFALYRKKVAAFCPTEGWNWRLALLALPLTASLIVPIRGGLQQIPINLSSGYFSQKQFANHSAINIGWNMLYSITEQQKLNPNYQTLAAAEAEQIVRNLYPKADSLSPRRLKVARPNVIIIILESFTANLVAAVGGEAGITPHLNQIADEGILFQNFYSNGDRTEKGLISVLSGYPALPIGSIAAYPKKTQQLPSLWKDFAAQGYHRKFYYGGELGFANMNAYLIGQGLENSVGKSHFPASSYNSKWGAYDHVVLDTVLADCNQEQQPFFKTVLTLTSHEPFEVPMETVIAGDDEPSLFRNSVVYTDRSIGDFIQKSKKSPWWDSTLIVLVADHGHRLPAYLPLHSPQRFKIPMIWTGGAVAQPEKVDLYAQQSDIAATLLEQLGWPHQQYQFSKPIFAPSSRSFAFYAFNDGWGWLQPDGRAVLDNRSQQNLEYQGDSSQLNRLGRAYLQLLSEDFQRK